MRKKGNNKTIKSKTSGTTEAPANKSGLKRQLADQLTTVFIVGLLCLWLGTLQPVPVRIAWWFSTILSVSVVVSGLILWLFRIRKRKQRSRRWWVFICVMVAFVWFAYWISGIVLSPCIFTGFAFVLLTWAVVLFLALVLIITWWKAEGKLGKAITWVVKQGDYLYRWLSILALWVSVLMWWARLRDAGMSGWLMYVLLCLGLLIALVVELVQLSTRHQEDGS